jgi:hypothetical protein
VSEVAVTSIGKPALTINGRGKPLKGGEVMDKMRADDDGGKGVKVQVGLRMRRGILRVCDIE